MNFIFRCIGIILEILFYGLIVSVILFFVSCSSVQTGGGMKASYQQTEKEIQDILKDDNLTPAQKIVLKHAVADLKDAQAAQKQQARLQDQIIKASEKAGAGKLIYYIMYFVVFLVIAFMGFKILKKFSLF